MFTTIFTSISIIASLQTNDASLALQPAVTSRLPMAATSVLVPRRAYAEHLEVARRAMRNGEFDVARREFAAAAEADREAGRLPLEAVTGLAHALYSQSYNREAALAMERLAKEAAARNDVNVEAVALADAIWLNNDAGQRITARRQADRLLKILKDSAITTVTRDSVRARVG